MDQEGQCVPVGGGGLEPNKQADTSNESATENSAPVYEEDDEPSAEDDINMD